jgi:hypothetical protein
MVAATVWREYNMSQNHAAIRRARQPLFTVVKRSGGQGKWETIGGAKESSMRLGKSEKIFLKVVGALVLLICLFPPYNTLREGRIETGGYGFLLTLPDGARIEMVFVVQQLIFLAWLAGIAWIILRGRTRKNKEKQDEP